jgi:hypothetical protein
VGGRLARAGKNATASPLPTVAPLRRQSLRSATAHSPQENQQRITNFHPAEVNFYITSESLSPKTEGGLAEKTASKWQTNKKMTLQFLL